MADYNRVIVAGRLTRDPELRYIPSGTAVSELGVVVNDRVKKGNEYVDEPCWLECVAWGRTAELANEYLTKGSPLLIEGRLKTDSWEDKDGNKRSKTRITIDKLQFLSSKPSGERQQREPATVPSGADESDPFGDDVSIPF